MQFIDLHAQYRELEHEIKRGIDTVLEHGKYIMGPEVVELEEKLAEYVGVKHCISCANGTDALELSLLALGIGRHDAVFVPSFTFMSTAEVVSSVGALPVFVDVDPDTFNMSPDSLEAAIEAVGGGGEYRPAAIIPVDLFGLPANYEKILPIAKRYDLAVVEDGAQGFGGAFNGKRACGFGDLSTTSFFPAKPLGCYGDGGAIFTDNDEFDNLLRSLRVHGKGSQKYDNVRIGKNSRLDTIQAAILLPKLKAFAEYELDARNKAAAYYESRLKDHFKTPQIPEGYVSSWAQYTLLLDSEEERDALQSKLRDVGVPSMIYYPRPLHLQPAFSGVRGWGLSLTASEEASRRVLSIPMHPYLTEADLAKIANAVLSEA